MNETDQEEDSEMSMAGRRMSATIPMANYELPSDIWAGAVDIHPAVTTEKWGMNARRGGSILPLAPGQQPSRGCRNY